MKLHNIDVPFNTQRAKNGGMDETRTRDLGSDSAAL